jgi:hypothetical protein
VSRSDALVSPAWLLILQLEASLELYRLNVTSYFGQGASRNWLGNIFNVSRGPVRPESRLARRWVSGWPMALFGLPPASVP